MLKGRKEGEVRGREERGGVGTEGGAVVVIKPSTADRAIVIAHGLPRYRW